MAKDIKGKKDAYLFIKISGNDYMYSAVIECYETLRDILYGLLDDDGDKAIVRQICLEVEASIEQKRFLNDFQMWKLPQLTNKLEKLLSLLKSDYDDIENYKAQIINVLQDIMEVITQDVMTNGHIILQNSHQHMQDNQNEERFQKLNLDLTKNRAWMEKLVRLHLLLTVKESAINVPMNLDARRRITFFTNSLFMNMPSAPKVRNMLSFRGQTLFRTVRGMMYYKQALELQCFLDMAEDR
ncbi:Callose synthase, partial [Thalictrum thalictroides]